MDEVRHLTLLTAVVQRVGSQAHLFTPRYVGVSYCDAHKDDVGHDPIARVLHMPNDGAVYDDELA